MDDLDELLGRRDLPPEPAAVRAAIGSAASRVQRRRRWRVRGQRVVVLGVCYAAGLVSMWYWSSRQARPPEVVERLPVPEPAGPPAADDPYRHDPPERIEKWAFLQAGEKRAELYRRAGDGYLLGDDVQAALRCYRRALDGASAADLAIQADTDTWLLMSLKMARNKEKRDAKVN